MTKDQKRERAQVRASHGMDQDPLFHSYPHLCGHTVSSSPSHTGPPVCARSYLDGDLWPGHQGCSLERCRAPRTATSESSPSEPRTRVYVCVCMCVCTRVSPELPVSSSLTPLLTCPPAPDRQAIWNVTVLPNSKWANITWKHNFGPGTDFVVEYIDSKHC